MMTLPLPASPPQRLVRQLRREICQMNMLPEIANRAVEIARDPYGTIEDIAALAEKDLKLTIDFLSLVNREVPSSGQSVLSLHQAVVQLGLRKSRNLLLTSSISGLVQEIGVQQQSIREQLWRHGFTTAVIALHLNCLFRLFRQGDVFTAGLLHDLGRTLLTVVSSSSQSHPFTIQEGESILSQERDSHMTDHCEFGSWYASDSGLPEELVAVIRHHHSPDYGGEHCVLVHLIMAADHIADHLQSHLDDSLYDPEENEAIARLSEIVGQDFVSLFEVQAETLLRKAAQDSIELMKPGVKKWGVQSNLGRKRREDFFCDCSFF